LLILGEIGREADLSEHKGVDEVVFGAFESKSDTVQNAASFALGNIACGNMGKYLKNVLTLIKDKENQRYLLLQSMKEIIARHSNRPQTVQSFQPYVDIVTPILFENAESKDEGVRGMVAECLGRLAIINSSKILPLLESEVKSEKPFTRAVIITALRYTLSGGTDALMLKDLLSKFLVLLKDTDLIVRRQTVLTVNALAHANVELLGNLLKSDILPVLYAETNPNEKLVRQVDYGCFKVSVDDGLPIRKAAFQALETLLDVAPHRLDMKEYVNEIQKGLNDHDDIQIVTYNILHSIATWHGASLLQLIDEMPTAIMKSVRQKLKEVKEKEPERAQAVLRTAVRALFAMRHIPGVEICTKFTDFYLRVLQTALLAKMLTEMNAQ